MAEMLDVITLTTISSDWGNDIRDRTVQRYSSVANRTSEHPSPSEGDLSYLEDANALDIYTGAAWVPVFLTNEIDGSVEVLSPPALTGSFAAMATVNLTIPAGWGSWKCDAYATSRVSTNPPDGQANLLIRIDGTDQQAQSIVAAGQDSFAIGGRRTGMTTTGSRAVSLMGLSTGGTANVVRIFLYARAVRTS